MIYETYVTDDAEFMATLDNVSDVINNWVARIMRLFS